METTEFEFDLVFALADRVADEAAILDALFEAGCDDAVVGLGQAGLLGLSFTRFGADAETAIRGAFTDAMRALPDGARLRKERPDLVSLAPGVFALRWNGHREERRPLAKIVAVAL